LPAVSHCRRTARTVPRSPVGADETRDDCPRPVRHVGNDASSHLGKAGSLFILCVSCVRDGRYTCHWGDRRGASRTASVARSYSTRGRVRCWRADLSPVPRLWIPRRRVGQHRLRNRRRRRTGRRRCRRCATAGRW
jgi:hypothetical protein